MTGRQQSFTHANFLGAIESKNTAGASNLTAAASATGNMLLHSYDEETMFDPVKSVEVSAKTFQYSKNGHTARYVVPAIDSGIVATAVEVFSRFAKDTDQVELFYRKFIRNFPATVHLFGTATEIAAFEATEAAKIPNNKLIVGRSNSKVHFVNLRDDAFNVFTALVHMGDRPEQEIIAYMKPVVERWLKDSFVSRSLIWHLEEEFVRSMETLPVPASNYELRCITQTLERVVKATINAFADLPWASEDYSCPTRGFDVTSYRPAAEAGLW
eukprot:GILI01016060.1.p1 GENE.GILI01016060.1~~GILI01016060.1.p1  ORF type:complete len:313 (-),score=60.54 GILI01016060.1:233-1045(-)